MTAPPAPTPPASGRSSVALLALAALGVVFGDIGTSPLYALRVCFSGPQGAAPTPENVLGVLSLVFWSLNFLITFKYLTEMMRVDNRGEGGILALLALARPHEIRSRGKWLLISVGLFGSALLYGDGMITPAISVLGAVEGLAVATPIFDPYVMWIAMGIILILFLIQRHGTAGVGAVFGPITVVWFGCITILGLRGIMLEPSVLQSINPWHAVSLFLRDPGTAFLLLAAVVLVVTGGEALYADMGHFGRRPIRIAWLAVVLPALVINYFGQGAMLLRDPAAVDNPFYSLVPRWGLYPMVLIATVAAITASQALISGAFSLTQQAVQLGYSPRVTIIHTSRMEKGQIYIPEVNWALMVACLALVVGFGNATNLAGTYGVAVCGTMATTTILFAAVAPERLGWPIWKVVLLGGLLLAVDLAFFAANLTKIPHGGWFPLTAALVVFILMVTWKRGRHILTTTMRENSLPLELFMNDLARRNTTRVSGTAVFMTSDATIAPPVLLHHLKHNKVLHERVILMSVVTREIPQVPEAERIELVSLGQGFYVLVAAYGFMESPHVPNVLAALEPLGLEVKLMETTFYLGRETLIPTRASIAKRAALAGKGLWMSMWRKKLFVVMTNNARSATSFFHLPANRVVELGAQVQI